jgi:ribosomal protein L16 Arg81 hydroxylase
MANIFSFEHLVAPLTIEDFFQSYWEKSFVHSQHKEASYFDEVLTIADIDQFLSQQNLMPDGIRIMDKGTNIPSADWTRSDTLLNGSTTRIAVDNEKLFKLFNNGKTIIISSAEKSIPRLAGACSIIEQQLKFRVQANIYITPPGSQGFAIHYDPHDIFLMQIKGPKTWRIYDSGEDLPVTSEAFRKEPELISKFEINSGDFLYIPRGTPHEAYSSAVSTIHVNFSLKPIYGYQLVEGLARLAADEYKFFRQTIPHGFQNEDDKKAYLDKFKAKLNELIEQVSPIVLLEKQKRHFVTSQLLNYEGRLISALELENITLETVVSRRNGFTTMHGNSQNALVIQFGEQKLNVPTFIERDVFLQNSPFKIGEIQGLISNQGKLDIARQLIEAGFLKIENH